MPDPLSEKITAIIVNYKTFALTRQAVWSLHGHYPDLPVIVADNNSQDGSVEKLKELSQDIPALKIQENGKNLHHGPAMDQIARSISTEWFLTFDSDAILYRPGFLEEMMKNVSKKTYAIGHQMHLNDRGFKVDEESGIPYIHPFAALFRTNIYQTLPPFEKHGSPCLKNEKHALKEGWELKFFPAKDYVFHLWEGTAGKTGHKLGWRSKIEFILQKLGI